LVFLLRKIAKFVGDKYMSMDHWRNNADKGKACHSATFSTTHPTQTSPGLNPGLHCKGPPNNHLPVQKKLYLHTS